MFSFSTNVCNKQSLRRNPSSLITPRLVGYYEDSGPLSHSGKFLPDSNKSTHLEIQSGLRTTNFDK